MRKRRTIAILAIVCMLLLCMPTAWADEKGSYTSTQSFRQAHYMIGLLSECKEAFYAGEWDIKEAEFTLSFSTTQIVSENLSDITISINGVRFYSERIPVTDGLRREVTVNVPIEHIKVGYNVIEIEGYVRTFDGLPCVDDVTTANWMNIFKESSITIDYEPTASCDSIAEFYDKFLSIEALENHESAVVVGTAYDSDELDAALTTVAGLSRHATLFSENIHLQAADDTAYLKNRKYVIYIAKPNRLPESLKAILDKQNLKPSATESTMALMKGDLNVLIVSGEGQAALDRAAAILSDKMTMRQLRDDVKIIHEDADVAMRKEGVKQYTPITKDGVYVKGAFRQSANFFIDFPQSRKLAYGSEVDLRFRYAENLDFDRSLVTVYVNDIPIGSQKLSQKMAEGDTATFTIPTDIDVAGSFTLKVSFDMEIKDLWCTLRQPETPWAYVSEESMLKINSVEVPYYLFENYPYPFISGGEFSHTLLIVPDNNRNIDLTILGDMMETMGRFLKYNTGEFSVARASNPGTLEGKNIIAWGAYEDHPFIQGLNDKLFFKFSDDGSAITSNEKLLIDPTYGPILGTAQLLDSPYSTTKDAVLVISSPKKRELGRAGQYFGRADELWKLYGDGFVADESELYLYRFKEDNKKTEPVTQQLTERTDLMRFMGIAGGIGLILLVAIISIVIKHGRRRRS